MLTMSALRFLHIHKNDVSSCSQIFPIFVLRGLHDHISDVARRFGETFKRENKMTSPHLLIKFQYRNYTFDKSQGSHKLVKGFCHRCDRVLLLVK